MDFQILFAIAMPIAMVAGGIAAWRASKKSSAAPEVPLWKDDSLEDWRKERDAQAEVERLQRPNETHLSTGSEEQQETKKHHQRLGG